MKVKVKLPSNSSSSYGGKRVYDGDVIVIHPSHFSKKWMIEIKEPAPEVEEQRGGGAEEKQPPKTRGRPRKALNGD